MKQMRGMCLNWKVLVGLAAVGIGVWILAPDLVAAALPLLLIAVCPLSMLAMFHGMQNLQGNRCAAEPRQERGPALNGRTSDEHLSQLKTTPPGQPVT